MAEWIRNLIVLVVMACWCAYIIISLIRGNEIPQSVWPIPGIIYYALNPRFRSNQSKANIDKTSPSNKAPGGSNGTV